ncbi:MAG TPA: ornithine cyclodeaminase family protein [Candidatus Binataceae bacterium]|nr:ornithine cyclodeaminase family protein [Candidatus Binataceae bacterium]
MLLLKHEDVCASVSMADAIEAMEEAFREEGEGAVTLPARINMKAGKGWLRVGPVALERSGWSGFKAMNMAPGVGVRYQVHLYNSASGELLAIMDAQHLTTLRTGATSAVATRRLARSGPQVVALLGSGVEARAQLEAMEALGIVKRARVFSPTAANRQRLAADFGVRMDIRAVDSARAAVEGCDLVLAAVKSTQTVLLGEWLRPGMHVNSVGTARRDQREIDPATFKRSEIIVVDTREGVFGEAGDAVAAKDTISPDQVHELSELVVGKAPCRTSPEQITLFKSVGTGVQDIALAAMVYRRARERGLGVEIDGFPIVKPA